MAFIPLIGEGLFKFLMNYMIVPFAIMFMFRAPYKLSYLTSFLFETKKKLFSKPVFKLSFKTILVIILLLSTSFFSILQGIYFRPNNLFLLSGAPISCSQEAFIRRIVMSVNSPNSKIKRSSQLKTLVHRIANTPEVRAAYTVYGPDVILGCSWCDPNFTSLENDDDDDLNTNENNNNEKKNNENPYWSDSYFFYSIPRIIINPHLICIFVSLLATSYKIAPIAGWRLRSSVTPLCITLMFLDIGVTYLASHNPQTLRIITSFRGQTINNEVLWFYWIIYSVRFIYCGCLCLFLAIFTYLFESGNMKPIEVFSNNTEVLAQCLYEDSIKLIRGAELLRTSLFIKDSIDSNEVLHDIALDRFKSKFESKEKIYKQDDNDNDNDNDKIYNERLQKNQSLIIKQLLTLC